MKRQCNLSTKKYIDHIGPDDSFNILLDRTKSLQLQELRTPIPVKLTGRVAGAHTIRMRSPIETEDAGFVAFVGGFILMLNADTFPKILLPVPVLVQRQSQF